MNPELQGEYYSRMMFVDTETRPMHGTDIGSPGRHQYTKLAVVKLRPGSPKHHDRYFVAFIESKYLFDHIHDVLKTESWIREEFDNRWIYIEEVLHRPKANETIHEYTSYIPQSENDLWLALYRFFQDHGVMDHAAKMFHNRKAGLPKTDEN